MSCTCTCMYTYIQLHIHTYIHLGNGESGNTIYLNSIVVTAVDTAWPLTDAGNGSNELMSCLCSKQHRTIT